MNDNEIPRNVLQWKQQGKENKEDQKRRQSSRSQFDISTDGTYRNGRNLQPIHDQRDSGSTKHLKKLSLVTLNLLYDL